MKVLFVLPLFLASASVMALPEQDCDFWKEKASLFMNWRQQQVPISEAVSNTSGNLSRGLLLRAYAEPVVSGLEQKYDKIENFTQEIYQECELEDK